MIIKNYKELCAVFGVQPTTGNAKKAQLKEFERYCDLEKIGHKYFIAEVYENPLPKEDKRHQGNNSKYVKLIEIILLSYLSVQKNLEYSFTMSQLYKILCMVNENYITYKNDERLIYFFKMKCPYVREWLLDNFIRSTSAKLTRIIRQALNSLQQRRLIDYSVVKCGKLYRQKGYTEITDSERIEKIMKCEYEALKECGATTKKDIFFKRDLWIKYTKSLKEKLIQELNCVYVFDKYKIIANRKYIADGLETVKQELNNLMCETLKADADKEYTHNIESNSDFRLPVFYTDIQNMFIDFLISINAKSIDFESEDIKEFISLKQLESELFS